MEYSSPWSRAYRLYRDAAGAAFEKAFRRYLDGKQSNPMSWSWGLIKYASRQAGTDRYRRDKAKKRGSGQVRSLDQPVDSAVPRPDGLTWDELAENGQQATGTGSAELDDPAKLVAARDKLEGVKDEPLTLARMDYISQEEAAEKLGVSQPTVSRRLEALKN